MSRSARVVWTEGMFLRTQHFQQQDRWSEQQVRATLAGLRTNGWGISELEIDPGLLAQGKVALRRCRGILPDGTPFSIPDEAPAPAPLQVASAKAQTMVWLALPVQSEGAGEIDLPDQPGSGARYLARDAEVRDTVAPAQETAPIQIALPAFRLLNDEAKRDACTAVAVARVRTAEADGGLALDPDFVPPCLRIGASPWLCSFLDELAGKLNSIALERAAFVTGKRPGGASDIADFLILQLSNRYLAAARHLAQQRTLHPEDFYRWLAELLGEACSFSAEAEVMPELEPYRHGEPGPCFIPLFTRVRQILLDLARPNRPVTQIPLRLFQNGVRAAEVQDRTLFDRATFIVAVQAPVAAEQIRQRLPHQIAVGPAEELQTLVTSAIPGIPIRPLATPPREIPVRRNMVYFELDRQNECWRRLSKSAGLALHVTGDLRDGMEMECWAILG
jgi:type VI secretion system protein ImpJ